MRFVVWWGGKAARLDEAGWSGGTMKGGDEMAAEAGKEGVWDLSTTGRGAKRSPPGRISFLVFVCGQQRASSSPSCSIAPLLPFVAVREQSDEEPSGCALQVHCAGG